MGSEMCIRDRIGGWANFEVALANNKNLVWTRESAPTKDVGTTDVPTTIPYKCIVQHQVQLVSGKVGVGLLRLVHHPVII